jgi:hypothetical protein
VQFIYNGAKHYYSMMSFCDPSGRKWYVPPEYAYTSEGCQEAWVAQFYYNKDTQRNPNVIGRMLACIEIGKLMEGFGAPPILPEVVKHTNNATGGEFLLTRSAGDCTLEDLLLASESPELTGEQAKLLISRLIVANILARICGLLDFHATNVVLWIETMEAFSIDWEISFPELSVGRTRAEGKGILRAQQSILPLIGDQLLQHVAYELPSLDAVHGKMIDGLTSEEGVARITEILRSHNVSETAIALTGERLAQLREGKEAQSASKAPPYLSRRNFLPNISGSARERLDAIGRIAGYEIRDEDPNDPLPPGEDDDWS